MRPLALALLLISLAPAAASPTDLSFKDVELSDIFRTIAQLAKVNVVIAADVVPAKATHLLRQVEPLDGMLLIARAHGCRLQRVRHEEGTTTVTYMVSKADGAAQAAHLTTRRLRLRYASVAHVMKSLGERISEHTGARPAMDERTNSLIVRGTEHALSQVADLITDLDLPVPEAHVHFRLVALKAGKSEPVWSGSVLAQEGRPAQVDLTNAGKTPGWKVAKLDAVTRLNVNADNFGNLELAFDAAVESSGTATRAKFQAAFQTRDGEEVQVGEIEAAPGQSIALKVKFELVKAPLRTPPLEETAAPKRPAPARLQTDLDLDGL